MPSAVSATPSVTPSESSSRARSAISVRSHQQWRRDEVCGHVVRHDQRLPGAKHDERDDGRRRKTRQARLRAVGGAPSRLSTPWRHPRPVATGADTARRTRDASRNASVRGYGSSIGTDAMMRPGRAAMTTTRVERNTASTMLWVTNTTVSLRADHSASNSTSSRCRVNSSSAPKGSSISSRSGDVTSARAIDARICMPPDSSRGNCPAASDKPTRSSAAANIAVRRRRARSPARSSGSRTLVSMRAHGISVGA